MHNITVVGVVTFSDQTRANERLTVGEFYVQITGPIGCQKFDECIIADKSDDKVLYAQ